MKACIFDLDGVLVDTAKYHYLAWKRLAKELGFVFTPVDNEKLKGISRMQSLDILLEVGNKKMSEENKKIYANKKNEWYKSFIAKMKSDEILPGVLILLENLKKANYKIALGSASKNANLILKKTNLFPYFDAIIDGNKVKNTKPDPEVFLLAAQVLQVVPQDCIVFEDAQAGVLAAKSAKMKCIGVGSKEVLKNADWVVESLHQLKVEQIEKFYDSF